MARKHKKHANVKKLSGGRYLNTKAGSKRKGKVFTIDKETGAHLYKRGGKTIRIGGHPKPFNPDAPIRTEKEFNSLVGSAANLKYGGAERDLQAQQRISAQQSANVGSWYDQYKADVARANASTAQGYQQATQGVYNQSNTARVQDAAQAQKLDQAAQAQAALRGTSAGPSVAPQAAAARQALSNSFGGMLATQGAAQRAYGNVQYSNAGGMKASALTAELANRRKLDQQARDLATEKGQYAVEYGQSLRDKEHTKRLENAAYGLKAQDSAIAAADKMADNRRQARKDAATRRKQRHDSMLADKRFRLDQKKYGSTKAKDNYQRAHGLGPYKQSSSKGGSGKAVRRKAGYGGTNVSLPSAVTNRKQWESLLRTGGSKPPKSANKLMVAAAQEYYKSGHKVSKKTALKIWHVFGFRIPYHKPGKTGKRIKRTAKKHHIPKSLF
jgi:hypothetical protein